MHFNYLLFLHLGNVHKNNPPFFLSLFLVQLLGLNSEIRLKLFRGEENEILYSYLKEHKLTIKDYLVGNRLTLADIILFRFLRFFMMFHFPEKMRNNIIPNITKWFKNIMETNEAIKAYGRTI